MPLKQLQFIAGSNKTLYFFNSSTCCCVPCPSIQAMLCSQLNFSDGAVVYTCPIFMHVLVSGSRIGDLLCHDITNLLPSHCKKWWPLSASLWLTTAISVKCHSFCCSCYVDRGRKKELGSVCGSAANNKSSNSFQLLQCYEQGIKSCYCLHLYIIADVNSTLHVCAFGMFILMKSTTCCKCHVDYVAYVITLKNRCEMYVL